MTNFDRVYNYLNDLMDLDEQLRFNDDLLTDDSLMEELDRQIFEEQVITKMGDVELNENANNKNVLVSKNPLIHHLYADKRWLWGIAASIFLLVVSTMILLPSEDYGKLAYYEFEQTLLQSEDTRSLVDSSNIELPSEYEVVIQNLVNHSYDNYETLRSNLIKFQSQENSEFYLGYLAILEQNYEEAIEHFSQQLGKVRKDNKFYQRTQYYLVLSLWGAGEIEGAKDLSNQIINDQSNAYRNKAIDIKNQL